MRITVDFNRPLDHGFVQFGDARPVARIVESPEASDLVLHLDGDGRLVGLELLELARRVGSVADEELPPDPLEDLLGGAL